MTDNSNERSGCSRTSVITLSLVLLVVACLIAPWVEQAREDARRHQSRNLLKSIGMGLHNYESTFLRYPPGGVFGADGTAYHGWTTAIHTYVWSSPWYNLVDSNVPWDDPRQVALFRDWEYAQTKTWTNPSVSPVYRKDGLVFNHYAGNQTLFFRNSSADRFHYNVHSGRLMVADAFDHQIPVGSPYAWRDVTLGFQTNPDGFGCKPRNFTQCLMADNSVREVAKIVDQSVITEMSGRSQYLPKPQQVAKPTDFPFMDVNRVWRIERIPDEDSLPKNDRFRRIPPAGEEGAKTLPIY